MARLLAILLWVESVVATIAYVIVAGLLLGEIIARDVFSTTIWGSLQMAVFAAIAAGFLGLSLATAANAHLRPQFADYWWPEAWRPTLARIGDAISAVIFTFAGWLASVYIADTFTTGDRAAVLYWPMWPFQLVIAYAFYASALRHLIFALRPDLKPQPSGAEG